MNRLVLCLCALALSAPARLSAQAAERAVFVTMIGQDTLAVESSSIANDRAESTLWLRTPIMRFQRTVSIGAQAMATGMTLAVGYGPRADSLPRRISLVIAGDSGRTHTDDGTEKAVESDRAALVPRGAVPYLNLSGQSLELILKRARALGRDTATVALLLTGLQHLDAKVTRVGADSALLSLGGVVIRIHTDSAGRMLGGTVPSQRVTIDRMPGDSPASSWRPARVSYEPPAGAPYSAEDASFRSPKGIAMAGTLTIPKHKAGARVPAVVLITGSGPQDRDESTPLIGGYRPFREIADTLSRRGIAVLRLDDRGIGGTDAGPATATTADFADDVRAAVAWLRARNDIDPARIGLVGHSEGGAIAPMIGSTDRKIRALVLIAAPASRGRELMAGQRRYAVEHDTSVAPTSREALLSQWNRMADSALTQPGWLHWFAEYDPLPAVKRVKAPTLILQGETDAQVPASEARTLAAAMRRAGNQRVTTIVFPRMNHLMLEDASGDSRGYTTLPSKQVRRDLLGAIADWLSRTL